MPDEIEPRIDNLGELAGKRLNHIVAAPVAEGIVEGLEVVDVDVGRHKGGAGREQRIDAFVDRHIARQLGQRVGITGGMNLHLGDHRHQVMGAADAGITAFLRDDKAVEHVMAWRQRQHHRQLLYGRPGIHHQWRRVHEQLAALAPEQLLAERPGKTVDQAVAVDHADRQPVTDHRQDIQLGIALETGDHRIVACVGGNRRHRLEQAGSGRHPAGAAAEHGQRGTLAPEGRQHRPRQLADRLHRRSGDEVALAAGDPHVTDTDKVFGTLDAFGHQRGIADFGKILHRPDEVELDAVVGDAVNEVAVDLDEFRSQLRPHTQVGKAFAQIVDGDLETPPAIVLNGLLDTRQIGNLLILGQLDDDAVRRQPQLGKQLTGLAIHHPRVEQGAGRGIEEQATAQTLCDKRPQADFTAGMFELQPQVATGRCGKELVRAMQRTALRPANQGLVAKNAA